MDNKFVTVAELAERVEMDRSSLRRWLIRNDIPMEQQRRRDHQGQTVNVVSRRDADKVIHMLTKAEGY